ncbi:hypothetical protein Tco_0900578 [Tanacetum coccineum]
MKLESGTKKLREKLNEEEDSEEEALEEFNSTLDNVVGEVVLYPPVHEYVTKEVIEMANNQAEALSDQEVADECLDDKQIKERRPSKRIRVTQEEMVKDEKPKKG